MYKPAASKACIVMLCSLFVLSACKKDDKNFQQQPTPDATATLRNSGVVADDTEKVARVPLIVSNAFYTTQKEGNAIFRKGKNGGTSGGGGSTPIVDTDGDGIADANDACPTQPETYNGYQDGDGCPDTAPTTTVLPPPPTTLPSSYQLITPPVGYQGSEFSCAAFATINARSVEQFYKTNASAYSFSSNVFSPEFLYNQTKISSDCGSGTGITLALDFMKNTGVCTWQSMPYSDVNGCSLLPTAYQLSEAAAYKISSYSKLVSSDQTAIKTMLVNKHAIITSVDLDQSFINAGSNFIWKSYTTGRSISHALIICGYDDARHAYKVMNSWGTGWGDAGYSWIDYDFFPQAAFYYSYVISL